MVYLYNVFPNAFGLMFKLAGNFSGAGYNAVVIIGWVVTAIIAYLLGSLNSAIIVSKWKFGQDIRSFGSGNAGLTNMHRVYGKDGAIYTLVGDIGKQIISVFVGVLLLGATGAYVAGTFCIIGHILPVYYHFKGGKGVLTAATMILLIDPAIFAVLFIIFALVLAITRFVSLSSIICAFCYPFVVNTAAMISNGGKPASIFDLSFAILIGVIVIYMHRTNIKRLFNGQESKFSFKKKKDSDTKKK